MGLFLFRFWPVLIPLLVYVLWFLLVRHKAVMAAKPLPGFRDGPWYWLILSTLLIGALCFIALGVVQTHVKGTYIPPEMKDGKMIPAHVSEGK